MKLSVAGAARAVAARTGTRHRTAGSAETASTKRGEKSDRVVVG